MHERNSDFASFARRAAVCRAHQVLFAALFFAVKAHREQHLLRLAIFPARLHDEARKMPVAVPHGVFEHHGILVPQSLRERRKVEKRLDIGQILRHDALLARCAHMDACSAAVSGQTVHLPLACNLFIMARIVRHRPLRIVKAEKAAQIAAIEDRHRDLGADALRLQDLVLARHLRFHAFNIRNDDRLAAAEDLQPVRHIRGNDLRQVVDLRRDAVRAPLKGVAIGLRRPLQPLEEKHAVRLHCLADQTQQAVDQFVHLLFAARAVDARELIDERKAVFCRIVRPCGHGRMFCLLHALVSFAAFTLVINMQNWS